jgi:hypothetical protein
MARIKQKRRDSRYVKSKAKQLSIQKATEASRLKRLQMRREREAGNQEPSINDTGTIHAQETGVEPVAVEELVAAEEPVEEPGQESVAGGEPVADQEPVAVEAPSTDQKAKEDEKEEEGDAMSDESLPVKEPVITKRVSVLLERLAIPPCRPTKASRSKAVDESLPSGSSPPKQTRRSTRSSNKGGSSSETVDPDVEATRYFARKKIGLTNATLRYRDPRVLKVHPSMLPRSVRVNSDAAKLNMQKKADAKKIAHHQAINRNWKQVRRWDEVGRESRASDGAPKPMFREIESSFDPWVPEGTVLSEFNRKDRPVSVFMRLLGGHETLAFILEATNDYIRTFFWEKNDKRRPPSRKIGGKPEGRKEPEVPYEGLVTIHELYAFLGIQFLIGYHRLPELSMYWERQPDSGYGLGIVQQAMTRERFKFISKHIACARPVELDEENRMMARRDPIGKIRPFVDALNDRFNVCRKPPKWQCIDESMVKFKGRSMLRQSMKGKPIKSGFKIWSRCCTRGYTYQFEIYHGSRLSVAPKSRNNDLVEGVVLDLCRPLAEQGHVVAFDRFFTSIDLLDKLNRNGINAVGTILPSRVNQPIMTKNESNLQQDEFVAKFGGEPGTCRKGIFIWRDTKAFRLASNYHGSEVVQVERKQRDGSFRKKPCPKAIADYVDNMGGVDTANQLRSYYERDRKSKKWWHRLFYSLMETCLVNSWICFCDLVSEKHLTNESIVDLLQFKRRVTLGFLYQSLNSQRAVVGREGRLTQKVHPSPALGPKRRRSRLSVREEIRFNAVGLHHPIFGEKRGRCEWCQATTESKREARPFSQCSRCQVFLCLSKKRNCFVEYHDERLFIEADEDNLEAVEAVDFSAEDDSEAADDIIYPLVIYSSSEDSDDDYIDISGREGYVIDDAVLNDNVP